MRIVLILLELKVMVSNADQINVIQGSSSKRMEPASTAQPIPEHLMMVGCVELTRALLFRDSYKMVLASTVASSREPRERSEENVVRMFALIARS